MIRLRLVGVSLLGGVVACASIAQLDAPDPDPLTADGGGSTDTGEGGAPVTLDGSVRTADGLRITPSELKFVFACGATASAPVSMTNDSDVAVPFEVDVKANPIITLRDAVAGVVKGEVAPHATSTVTVDAKSMAPGSLGADLVVKLGSSQVSLSVKADVQGSMLTITPPTADFGFVREGTPSSPTGAVFANTGNQEITITGFTGAGSGDFAFTTPIVIAPGGTTSATVVMTAGAASAPIAATLTPTVAGPLCAGQVPTIQLTGQRVSDAVIVGPPVEVGNVPCQGTPTIKPTISLSNYSISEDAVYTATLRSGAASRFAFTSNATGTVVRASAPPAPTKLDIVLTGKPVGGAFGDVEEYVDIKFSAPPDLAAKPAAAVKIHMLVYGAAFTLGTGSLTFDRKETISDPMTNTGNYQACLKYDLDQFSYSYSVEADDTFPPGLVDDVDVTFFPFDRSTHVNAVNISNVTCAGATAPAPLCTPLPNKITMTGRDNN